eukprot:Blabericola_migrator_1__1336@NODE_1347_length_4754_cov_366_921912_g904_i0_p3_GENE_NODE_1347_length_4754_cov_366_921912_g904_i0NODE_1347_length_4754_cov_366_921912_g904_i0_p3_ORF_typecomplete_len311_score37_52_NODE_1347_length_4754_cov_366_921912_g904_i036064538
MVASHLYKSPAPTWMPAQSPLPTYPVMQTGGSVYPHEAAAMRRTMVPQQYLPASPHRRHHHRHRSSPRRLNPLCCGLDAAFGDSGKRRRRQTYAEKMEFRERTGMAVSIDSADEDDWDETRVARKVWGTRKGPVRERPVDDLLITVQDLFPCFAPLFDCCGCGRKRVKRVLPCKAEPQMTNGPKLETVCLDCGNVIDAKHLPRTINLDMFDRQDPTKHSAFVHGMPAEEDSPNTLGNFDGYQEWRVAPDDPTLTTTKKVDYTPLPQFSPAPPRIFKNVPSATTRPYTDETYGVDDTGRVQLPEFPTGGSR